MWSIVLLTVAFKAVNAGRASLALPPSNEQVGIVGGHEVPIEQYPYHVALIDLTSPSSLCNGAIVAPNLVLTSAKCATAAAIDKLKIRAGSSDAQDGGSYHDVEQIFAHEGYIGGFWDNIAVVQVEPPFEFDETRQSIGLFGADDKVVDGVFANLTGYGVFDTEGSMDSKLRAVSLKIMNKGCPAEFFPGVFCAGEKGKSPCSGDWGSPLVIDGNLAGVTVGTHTPCGSSDYAGLFTDIAYYRQWLDDKLKL